MGKNTVTREDVLGNMQEVLVRTVEEFGKPTTYVTVRMLNGFTVRESTTCVDPQNYNEEIGKQVCLKKIEDKIWLLLGYALQENMSKQVSATQHLKEQPSNDFILLSNSIVISNSSSDGIGIISDNFVCEVDKNGLFNAKPFRVEMEHVGLKVDMSSPLKAEEMEIGKTYIMAPLIYEIFKSPDKIKILKVSGRKSGKELFIYDFRAKVPTIIDFNLLDRDNWMIYLATL